MSTWYQLPLIPSAVTHVEKQTSSEGLTSDQKNAETAFGFTYNWLGWFGALMMGTFDRFTIPDGYHFQSVTLCRVGSRWGVFLNAANNDGHQIKFAYTDLTREKALRGARYLMKRQEAHWQDKT